MFSEFQMDDTLFSWFLITELHVWLVAFRIMQEKKDNLRIRNYLIEAMWNDISTRTKRLEVR